MTRGLAPLQARYRAALARFLLTADELARETELLEAGDIGKQGLREGLASDQMLELHRAAQAALADAWRASPDGRREACAHESLARGDGTPMMLALTLPHQLDQLAHHEHRWRREHGTLVALFDQTGDLIVIVDAQGRLEDANAAFLRATGWDKAELLAGPLARWNAPLPAAGTEQHRAEQPRRDGSVFTVDWSVSPVFARDGQLLSHVCIGRDVTRQRQVEDGLRENDKLRAVATLAGGIAHDFNNLLGSIVGLAELCALEAVEGSRQARNLGRIRQAGAKAAVLVRQMLDFSRQTPKAARRMTVGELLAHAAGLVRPTLPGKVQLALAVEADSTVCVDLVQMDQVLMNIAGNAACAMRERGGTIRIVADRAEPAAGPRGAAHVRLRVIDEGEGIAPDLLGKIFEPFFTTKPVGEGTGLGLAAVHGIVSSHDGQVEVCSEPGVGTTFSLFLPVAADEPGAAA